MAVRHDKLLVLDLDETLIHGTELPLGREPEAKVGPYFIYHRPGVAAFLAHVLARFEVGVWTASTLSYAHPVLDGLLERDALAFAWGRERCTARRDHDTFECENLKDIRKLTKRGYDRDKILFVDDTPAKIARSYGNYVHIRPYEGAADDRELEHLAVYLDELGPRTDIRQLEKRGWRARF